MQTNIENTATGKDLTDNFRERYIDFFKSVFNEAQTAICIADYEGKIVEINNHFAELFGYEKSELVGTEYLNLLSVDSQSVAKENHKKIFNGINILKAEEKVKHKNGTYFYIQTTNLRVNDEDGNKLRITTAVDVTNRLKNELVQSVLLQISNLINNSQIDKNLYESIYNFLTQLMPIKNFAICLLNSKTNQLEFPYLLSEIEFDEKHNLEEEFKFMQKTASSFILSEKDIELLVTNSQLFEYIAKPNTILGIPLKIKNEIIGAVIIKDYLGNLYTKKDKEVLELVADQIAHVIERKNYEDELIAAKKEAEDAARLKSDFLAQISHEIRTPLNSILSFSALIKNELNGQLNPEMAETFEYIERGGNRLTRTIDLILNVSKIHNQKYKIELNEVNLDDDILWPIVKELHSKAFAKGIKLELKNSKSPLRLVCDQYSINQMFINLIDNAIKYTNKGSISIESFINPYGNIQVDIIDTGIGISSAYINKIFDPFIQEEQGYTRTYEGIGLGLSLVKSYAELNNAELKVKSEKNVGSIFSVIFNT
ncbi:MAG: PAS domain S-box protein [Ignavibacteriae bacterium]|nr:PAS domain S-box protein [Ignavibacteriota bacterium]